MGVDVSFRDKEKNVVMSIPSAKQLPSKILAFRVGNINITKAFTMLIICNGCGQSLKRNGIKNHIHTSTDPRCHISALRHHEDSSAEGPSGTFYGAQNMAAIDKLDDEMVVEASGDFFGDYIDYASNDFQGFDSDDDENTYQKPTDNNHDTEMEDLDEDILDAANANQEVGLEPERTHNQVVQQPEDENEENSRSETINEAIRLRGGAEESLGQKPVAVKFPGRQAGAIYSREAANLNDEYMTKIGNPENIFAPFSSQMEWEIARWAKLRGPSSTAFTELMKIDGVSVKFEQFFEQQLTSQLLYRSQNPLVSLSKTQLTLIR